MRSHSCPHCDFIYIGEQAPDGACPACGNAWTRRLLAAPEIPQESQAATNERAPAGRSRSARLPFLYGLAAGMLIAGVAATVGWRQFARVEQLREMRLLRSQHAQAQEQLAAVLEETRTAAARLSEAEAALAASESAEQAVRDELRALEEQRTAESAALHEAQTRLKEMEGILAVERARNGQSFVRHWQLLGPFAIPAGNAEDPLAKEPVELSERHLGVDGEVGWKRHESDSDRIGLAGFFGRKDPVVGYAVCWVHSEVERAVNLSIGSDDGVCVWINREKVHEHRVKRAASPGQDTARARLKAGWNEVLAKVDNEGSSEWDLYLEFRTAEDSRPLKVYSTNVPPASGGGGGG